MVFGFFDMVNSEGFSWRRGLGFVVWIVFWLWFVFLGLLQPVVGLRPLRERAQSWGDEWLFIRKDENDLGPFSMWNITGTYRGSWKFLDSTNSSSKFPDLRKSNGDSVIELFSRPTKINGVHYVQGVIIFHDVFNNEHNVGGAQIRVEGVYIWPFRQLRMVTNSGKEGELSQEEEYILSNPYHLLGVFSSQVFQDSPRDKTWRRKNTKSCLPFFQNLKYLHLLHNFSTILTLLFVSLFCITVFTRSVSLSLAVFYFASNLLIIFLFNVKILTFTEKTNKHHNFEV